MAKSKKTAKKTKLPPGMDVVSRHGHLGLRDSMGGTWWPTDDVTTEAALMRAYRGDRGEWKS